MGNQNTRNVLFGLMIGGMAGVATILLFAAKTVKLVRAKIRRHDFHWRDRTDGMAKQSSAQSNTVTGARTAGNMTVHVS
ncbi:MAG: hypothetical protein JW929_04705 [Anaerolineales bacterium]|nr:hypothetical protein [Anaerolineales bacterium]